MYGEPPVPSNSQAIRDMTHAGAIGTIVAGGFFAKRRIQNSLNSKLPDQAERVAASYGLVTIAGAMLGGALKAAKTGTKDGIIAGVIIGAIAALCGGVTSEVYDYYHPPRP